MNFIKISRQIRGEADEPGVVHLLGRAGLAGRLTAVEDRALARAVGRHDRRQGQGHLVRGGGRHHLRAVGMVGVSCHCPLM